MSSDSVNHRITVHSGLDTDEDEVSEEIKMSTVTNSEQNAVMLPLSL